MKKGITIIFLTTLLSLIPLAGCNKNETVSGGEGLGVWYRYKEISSAAGSPVSVIYFSTENKTDLLHEALKLLTADPKSDTLISSFPSNVHITSYNLSDGVLDVYLTAGYSEMSVADKSCARCCLVYTLTSLDEVDSVNIYQEGTLLEKGLKADMMLTENNDTGEYEEEITLYFPDSAMKALAAEKRQLTVASTKPLEQYVIEELFKGTQAAAGGTDGNENKQLMPEGTRLNSVKTEKGLCVVDFSEEFYKNRPLTSAEERLLLYSIVNSLTQLEGIDRVQITVGGEILPLYTYIDIGKPLTRAEEFIKTGTDYWTNSRLNVYLGTPGGRITAVNIAAGSLNYEQWLTSVAEYYISLDRFWGYLRLIPEGTRVLSAEAEGGVCRLNLSAEFRNNSESGMNIAVKAIAATLYDAEAAQSVIVLINGELLYNGNEITKDDRIIAD
jgi:germination protein M